MALPGYFLNLPDLVREWGDEKLSKRLDFLIICDKFLFMSARQEVIEGIIRDRAMAFFNAIRQQEEAKWSVHPDAYPRAVTNTDNSLNRLGQAVELQQRDNRRGCLGLIANSIIRRM